MTAQSKLYMGHNLLTSREMQEVCGRCAGEIVIIADQAVQELYAKPLAQHVHAKLLTLAGGEKMKTAATVSSLIDALCKMEAGKETTLIAVGGGVTTDLVGFVASIYMRGVPLILIPTTLLAIVDASIGGKTAINTPHSKNLIGTIHPPLAIFADLDTLETLPEQEWLNGLAEILKMGLIYDDQIWHLSLKNRNDPTLIFKAIQGKMNIVEQDPAGQAIRRILNFGHTVGHALETVSHYTMSHGEAVALGSLAETHLSRCLGFLSEREFEQTLAAYRRFPLKLPRGYTRDALLQAMRLDKKRGQGESRFVLIDTIGHAIPFEGEYCRAVSPRELQSTLDWMESK